MSSALQAKVLARIEQVDECWLWRGYVEKRSGFGKVHWGGISEQWAHRISWIAFNGEIPSGNVVCHRCERTDCVNPEHLFLAESTAPKHVVLVK